MNARLALKETLWLEHRQQCMMWYAIHHRCLEAPDLHEVFVKRGDIPKSKQAYMIDRANCVTACSSIHIPWGNTRWFDQQAARILVSLYGREAIEFYLATAPGKGRPSLDAILGGPDHGPPSFVKYRWIEPRL